MRLLRNGLDSVFKPETLPGIIYFIFEVSASTETRLVVELHKAYLTSKSTKGGDQQARDEKDKNYDHHTNRLNGRNKKDSSSGGGGEKKKKKRR